MNFNTEMQNLGFDLNNDGTYNLTDRTKGYDNDCSDDDRNDEFYEDRTDTFHRWANKIIAKVNDLAKKYSVKIVVDTSAEYGMIDVEVKK